MNQSENTPAARTFVDTVLADCPSLSTKWNSLRDVKTDHEAELESIALASGQILIALSSTEEEAIAWGERMDEIIGKIGAARSCAEKAEPALPYSETMLLMLEAIGRSGHSGVTGEDVKLFVRDRLADMRKVLEGLSNTTNAAEKGQPSAECLEERRMRSVVFHGDVFHKPTPQYS